MSEMPDEIEITWRHANKHTWERRRYVYKPGVPHQEETKEERIAALEAEMQRLRAAHD